MELRLYGHQKPCSITFSETEYYTKDDITPKSPQTITTMPFDYTGQLDDSDIHHLLEVKGMNNTSADVFAKVKLFKMKRSDIFPTSPLCNIMTLSTTNSLISLYTDESDELKYNMLTDPDRSDWDDTEEGTFGFWRGDEYAAIALYSGGNGNVDMKLARGGSSHTIESMMPDYTTVAMNTPTDLTFAHDRKISINSDGDGVPHFYYASHKFTVTKDDQDIFLSHDIEELENSLDWGSGIYVVPAGGHWMLDGIEGAGDYYTLIKFTLDRGDYYLAYIAYDSGWDTDSEFIGGTDKTFKQFTISDKTPANVIDRLSKVDYSTPLTLDRETTGSITTDKTLMVASRYYNLSGYPKGYTFTVKNPGVRHRVSTTDHGIYMYMYILRGGTLADSDEDIVAHSNNNSYIEFTPETAGTYRILLVSDKAQDFTIKAEEYTLWNEIPAEKGTQVIDVTQRLKYQLPNGLYCSSNEENARVQGWQFTATEDTRLTFVNLTSAPGIKYAFTQIYDDGYVSIQECIDDYYIDEHHPVVQNLTAGETYAIIAYADGTDAATTDWHINFQLTFGIQAIDDISSLPYTFDRKITDDMWVNGKIYWAIDGELLFAIEAQNGENSMSSYGFPYTWEFNMTEYGYPYLQRETIGDMSYLVLQDGHSDLDFNSNFTFTLSAAEPIAEYSSVKEYLQSMPAGETTDISLPGSTTATIDVDATRPIYRYKYDDYYYYYSICKVLKVQVPSVPAGRAYRVDATFEHTEHNATGNYSYPFFEIYKYKDGTYTLTDITEAGEYYIVPQTDISYRTVGQYKANISTTECKSIQQIFDPLQPSPISTDTEQHKYTIDESNRQNDILGYQFTNDAFYYAAYRFDFNGQSTPLTLHITADNNMEASMFYKNGDGEYIYAGQMYSTERTFTYPYDNLYILLYSSSADYTCEFEITAATPANPDEAITLDELLQRARTITLPHSETDIELNKNAVIYEGESELHYADAMTFTVDDKCRILWTTEFNTSEGSTILYRKSETGEPEMVYYGNYVETGITAGTYYMVVSDYDGSGFCNYSINIEKSSCPTPDRDKALNFEQLLDSATIIDEYNDSWYRRHVYINENDELEYANAHKFKVTKEQSVSISFGYDNYVNTQWQVICEEPDGSRTNIEVQDEQCYFTATSGNTYYVVTHTSEAYICDPQDYRYSVNLSMPDYIPNIDDRLNEALNEPCEIPYYESRSFTATDITFDIFSSLKDYVYEKGYLFNIESDTTVDIDITADHIMWFFASFEEGMLYPVEGMTDGNMIKMSTGAYVLFVANDETTPYSVRLAYHGEEVEEGIHTLTTLVNDATMGTVAVSGDAPMGNGKYADKAQVTLTAIPNDGYEFFEWSDGNTSASRTEIITDNSTFTATFREEEVVVEMVDVTFTPGIGGYIVYDFETITEPKTIKVKKDTEIDLTVRANEGYVIESITVNGETTPITDGGTEAAFDNLVRCTDDCSISVAFRYQAPARYFKLTAVPDDATKGSVEISSDNPETEKGYIEGTEVSLTAIANPGYKFVQWSDGDKNSHRTITMDKETNLKAIFSSEETSSTHSTVTFIAEEGGTIDIGGSKYTVHVQEIENGVPFDFWVHVDGNHVIELVTMDGEPLDGDYTGKFDHEFTVTFDRDCEIRAKFRLVKAEVNVTKTTGGKTNVDQYTMVNYGEDFTMHITADEGYMISAILVDGIDATTDQRGKTEADFTLPNVTEHTNVHVVFTKVEKPVNYYTLTTKVNDNKMGEIEVRLTGGVMNGSGKYKEGSSLELKAVANKGYEFVKWNDGNTTAARSVKITSDTTWTATFRKTEGSAERVTVTITAGEGGTVSPEGAQEVELGSDIDIEITADKGWVIKRIKVNGRSQSSDLVGTASGTYTYKDAEDGAEIEVLFAEDEPEENYYRVTATSEDEEMGIVTVTGGTTNAEGLYLEGSEITIIATPKKGYKFDRWSNGDTEPILELTVEKNLTYKAYFSKMEGTAVDNAEAVAMTVYTDGLTLNVTSEDKTSILVVTDAAGRVVYSGYERTVTLPQSGIYIVRLGNETAKVAAHR